MNVFLTPNERQKAWEETCHSCSERHICGLSACAKPDILEKAQLKRVLEWGEEECMGHGEMKNGFSYTYSLQRRQCSICWGVLLEEVK